MPHSFKIPHCIGFVIHCNVCAVICKVNSAYNLKPEIVCFQFKLPIWAIALDVFILRLDFFIVVNAHGNDGIALCDVFIVYVNMQQIGR